MTVSADAIVDTALRLGDERSWESVRLYQVAESLGTDLDAIRAHFREKEDLVEAWFDRADAAMLQRAAMEPTVAMPTIARLETLILAWLDALESHRRVTREMILGKLEFGHLHVQIPAVLRVSRTVQWLREAAGRDATGVYRGLEETVLTSIFVSAFAVWLQAPGRHRRVTARYLRRTLGGARSLSRWVPGYVDHHGAARRRLPSPERPAAQAMPEDASDPQSVT